MCCWTTFIFTNWYNSKFGLLSCCGTKLVEICKLLWFMLTSIKSIDLIEPTLPPNVMELVIFYKQFLVVHMNYSVKCVYTSIYDGWIDYLWVKRRWHCETLLVLYLVVYMLGNLWYIMPNWVSQCTVYIYTYICCRLVIWYVQ